MKNLKTYILIAAFAALFSSCAKDGATGLGPAGPQGAQGNANVSTTIFTINSWGWLSPEYYVDLSVPALTQSILDNGAVEVFISGNNGVNWFALPYTQVATINGFFSYSTGLGLTQINFEWNDSGADGDPNTYYGVILQAKVVCIDGSVIKKHPGTNWKNYNEVQEVISLNE